jgi:hypothetical protein
MEGKASFIEISLKLREAARIVPPIQYEAPWLASYHSFPRYL